MRIGIVALAGVAACSKPTDSGDKATANCRIGAPSAMTITAPSGDANAERREFTDCTLGAFQDVTVKPEGTTSFQITDLDAKDCHGAMVEIAGKPIAGKSYAVSRTRTATSGSVVYVEGCAGKGTRAWSGDSGTITIDSIDARLIKATVSATMTPDQGTPARGTFTLSGTVQAKALLP